MTTIRLGVTRYGPFAPDTCQLGKYDTFTNTGVPTLDTWKLTEVSVWLMSVTFVVATGLTGGVVSLTAPFNLPARFILTGTTAGRPLATNAEKSAATKRAQWRTI